MVDLSGSVALVTGAGQNLGRGITEVLGVRGAAVAVNDLHPERAAAVAEELQQRGVRSAAAPFDVGDHEATIHGIADVATRLGPIDILVNNAGIPAEMGVAAFRDAPADKWWPYLAVNALGPLNCVKAVLPHMRARRWGRVITIASDAFMGTDIGVAVYGASKGAGVAFMRNLALEEGPNGITANTISLGLFQREAGMGEVSQALARQIAVGRIGTPADLGALCAYLASDQAGYMNGQTLHLNGGAITS